MRRLTAAAAIAAAGALALSACSTPDTGNGGDGGGEAGAARVDGGHGESFGRGADAGTGRRVVVALSDSACTGSTRRWGASTRVQVPCREAYQAWDQRPSPWRG